MVEIRNKGEGFNRRNPDLAAEAAERRQVRQSMVEGALQGADGPLEAAEREEAKRQLQNRQP